MRIRTVFHVLVMMIAAACHAALFNNAQAGEFTAVVEDFSGSDQEIELLDLLEKGRVIDLSGGGQLVLGYFLSCVRETVTGGTVTIGTEESEIDGSDRSIEEVDCDGGEAVRESNNTEEIAGAVFRTGSSGESLPKPDWTLFGVKPLIMVDEENKSVTIERLDESQEIVTIKIKGSSVDGEKENIVLEPSGLYLISAGNRSRVVKVSPLAEENTSLLSRLVPM